MTCVWAGRGVAIVIRKHVYYTGTVQGVGFRYMVCRLAAGREVGGFVRNLPDGRVELVAEGCEDEVAGLVDDVQRRLGRHIRRAVVTDEPAVGDVARFEVAF